MFDENCLYCELWGIKWVVDGWGGGIVFVEDDYVYL